jgi:hypothetical protein
MLDAFLPRCKDVEGETIVENGPKSGRPLATASVVPANRLFTSALRRGTLGPLPPHGRAVNERPSKQGRADRVENEQKPTSGTPFRNEGQDGNAGRAAWFRKVSPTAKCR